MVGVSVDGAGILVDAVSLLVEVSRVLVYLDGVFGDLVGFLVDIPFRVLTGEFCNSVLVAAVLGSPH